METELKTHILSDFRPPRVPKSQAELHLSVGRYELVRRLAYGGMAAVYLGRALGKAGFEKTVAVKVIHPHLAVEQQFVEMFLDEARIVAGIQHPHVVQILDLGQDGELYYMIMEFVEGETLSALISSLAPRRLPLSVTIQIIADAVSGLAAAHDLRAPDGELYNIVHRDISPQNLLIDLLGWVKISDFGIMKVAGTDRNTRAGELRGKLAYMSPEQARGHDIDHRTDLFSVGVIFWELLTGRRLFVGENDVATLENVLACQIPRLDSLPRLLAMSQQSSEFREKLQSVLDRALARERCDRYADAPEMLSDVQALLRMCVQADDEEEPREQLASFMKEHFGARAAYARAALRETTPTEYSSEVELDATEPSELKIERQAGRSDLWAIPPVEPSSHSKLSTIAELHSRTKSSLGSQSRSVLDHWWFRSTVICALIVLFGSVAVLFSLRWQNASNTLASAGGTSLPSNALLRSSTSGSNSDISPIMATTEHKGGLLNIAWPDANQAGGPNLVDLLNEQDANKVRWEFTGSPPDASIYVDGELHSQLTPAGIDVTRDDGVHHVIIQKEGMRPIEYRLYSRVDQTIFYQLFPVDHGKNGGKSKTESSSRVAKSAGRSPDTSNEGPKFMPMPKFESKKLMSNQ